MAGFEMAQWQYDTQEPPEEDEEEREEPEYDEWEIAEERLKARDYDAWAAL